MTTGRRPLNAVWAVTLLLVGLMVGPISTALAGPMSSARAVEQASDAWDILLPALPVGTRLLLKLATGAEIEGRLVEVRPDAVVLDENRVRAGAITSRAPLSDPRTFSRTEVQRVSIVGVPPERPQGQAAESWDLVLPAVPPGGRVRLTLTDGAVLESRLVEARADALVVNDRRIIEGRFTTRGTVQEATTFSRADVARVAMVNAPTRYASTTPNAGMVRYLIASWGVGQNVDLQTVAGERIRSRVVSIEPGRFTVASEATAARIAYGEVLRLRQDRMGIGKKIAIGAAASVTGAVVFVYLICRCYSN